MAHPNSPSEHELGVPDRDPTLVGKGLRERGTPRARDAAEAGPGPGCTTPCGVLGFLGSGVGGRDVGRNQPGVCCSKLSVVISRHMVVELQAPSLLFTSTMRWCSQTRATGPLFPPSPSVMSPRGLKISPRATPYIT